MNGSPAGKAVKHDPPAFTTKALRLKGATKQDPYLCPRQHERGAPAHGVHARAARRVARPGNGNCRPAESEAAMQFRNLARRELREAGFEIEEE